MKRKGIPEKRIGPETGYRERSIRMRQEEGRRRLLSAAERNFCRETKVSLCGINPVMANIFYVGNGKKENKK